MRVVTALRARGVASCFAAMALFLMLAACSGVGVVATADPYKKLAQAKHLESTGRISRARQLTAEAAADFEENGDLAGLSEAYRQTAFLIRMYSEDTILARGSGPAELDTKRADASTAHFEKAIAIEDQLGNYGNLSNLHYNIGVNYALTARPAQACAAFDRSLAAQREGKRRQPDRKPILPSGFTSFEDLIGQAKQEAGCL